MGCASSKTDELPAVILCPHVAYIHSLNSVGVSLHRFFDSSTAIPPPSPVINLPDQRKLPPEDSAHLSSSNSGSHLHFHSDSEDDGHLHLHDDDDDDDDDGSLHHHVHDESPPSPPRAMMYGDGIPSEGGVAGFNPYLYSNGGNGYMNNGNSNMNINYMRKHVTPSVSYEQKPVSYETETVQYGDLNASSSSSTANYYDYFGGGYANNNNNNTNGSGTSKRRGGVGGYGGWNGGVPQQPVAQPKPAPPPPPPPSTSPWDFMNLFESIDNHYPPYTPSRDSREVREEEGIPDLEDEENYEHEVVKQVQGNQKLVDDATSYSNDSSGSSQGKKNDSKRVEKNEEVVGVSNEGESSLYRARVSAATEAAAPVEYEVHMVDKKVVGEAGRRSTKGKAVEGRSFGMFSRLLKKFRFNLRGLLLLVVSLLRCLRWGNSGITEKRVLTKMLNVITPSLPSSSKDDASVDLNEDVQWKSVNLSATLQKLYLWEKKLFEEVKIEEKMRVQHDRKNDRLKHLAEKGAEPQKIESTRDVVRSLSTKIRIAIQIVDRISAKINKLRDEELWPQLNELILGLSRMWKAMLECHHIQCEAIDGARGLDAIAFPNNPSDTHLEALLQLERDLLNWTCRFTEWIGAQKNYVRALNRWLLKCIYYEPEETADGIAPFSPGRAGCPPVFVICNQWDQSLERISETSEKDLIDSMRVFAMMVLHFRERDKGELRQRMTANRDMERKVKNIEREDVKMQKKIVLASGDSDGGLSSSGNVVYQSDTSSKTSLQAGLRHVFEAMDRFTADSVKAYDELLQRSEEVVREHGRVS
ncbi:Nitrate regulatory gene2 protein [Bienertia sinuspersici]